MFRTIRRLFFLAMGAYVLTTALPLAYADGTRVQEVLGQAVSSTQVGADALLPAEAGAGDVSAGSLGSLLGSIEGVRLTGDGAVLRTTSGRALTFEMDIASMGSAVLQPTGGGVVDYLKYGALASMAIGLVARVSRLFLRPGRPADDPRANSDGGGVTPGR